MKTFKSIMILTVLAVLGILINWSFSSAFLYAELQQAPPTQTPITTKPLVPLPDLVVGLATVGPPGFTVKIDVKNQGGSSAGPFAVKLSYLLERSGHPNELRIEPFYVNGLASGSFKTLQKGLHSSAAGVKVTIKEIFIDYTDKVAESNEGNNKVTY